MSVKKFAMLLVIVGLGFLAVGGYQLYDTKMAQNKSLAEARSLLADKKTDTDAAENDDIDNTDIAQSFSPGQGDTVGILNIPRLEADLPIVEGTHEDELKHGVGHYGGTAYPLQQDQIVLSGHRDTVFRRMGELEIGDILNVEVEYGEFAYEIVDTKVVDADDRTIIVPTAPDEVLTVTTCYPFSYVGSAPDRYIITALPVDSDELAETTEFEY